jgi:hypothetical protein
MPLGFSSKFGHYKNTRSKSWSVSVLFGRQNLFYIRFKFSCTYYQGWFQVPMWHQSAIFDCNVFLELRYSKEALKRFVVLFSLPRHIKKLWSSFWCLFKEFELFHVMRNLRFSHLIVLWLKYQVGGLGFFRWPDWSGSTGRIWPTGRRLEMQWLS